MEKFIGEIKKIYFIPTQGTVITTKIEQGKIKVGDKISAVIPGAGDCQVVCRGLAKNKIFVDCAQIGETVDVLIGVNWDFPQDRLYTGSQGCFLSTPDTIKVSKLFKARCQLPEGISQNPNWRLKAKIFDYLWLCAVKNIEEVGELEYLCDIELIFALNISQKQSFELYDEKKVIGTGIITEVIY